MKKNDFQEMPKSKLLDWALRQSRWLDAAFIISAIALFAGAVLVLSSQGIPERTHLFNPDVAEGIVRVSAAALFSIAVALFSLWRGIAWQRVVNDDDPLYYVTDGHAQQWDSDGTTAALWFVAALINAVFAFLCAGGIWLLLLFRNFSV